MSCSLSQQYETSTMALSIVLYYFISFNFHIIKVLKIA